MANHESRYLSVARLAYALTRKTLPVYTHAKSPHRFTWPQLASCVLMYYLRLSYRDMEEWLLACSSVCEILDLHQIPDHSTLCRAFRKLGLATLRTTEQQLLMHVQPKEEVIAVDSTGFRPDQASAYYQLRCGKPRREWIKGAYAVGIASQFIVASRHGVDRTNDVTLLPCLRSDAKRYAQRNWILLADAGFDGKTIQERDIIPPVRRHGKLIAPERQARADLVSQARLDGLYGQRWKCETVNSVIKRKFGDAVRSRKRSLQQREPIIKGLVYNLHR